MKVSIDEIKQMLDGKLAFSESETMEYKSQIHTHNCNMTKYIETICAFMNNEKKGGYLIFGITDNLKLVGLNQQKLYDIITLKFDNIIHQSSIYGKDLNDEIVPITPKNIRIDYVHNHHNKLFMIVDVTNDTENVVYQLKDGRIVYRLNASNYVNKKEIIYTQQMVDQKIATVKQDYQDIIDTNLKLYKSELTKKEKENTILLCKIDEKEKMIIKKDKENKELLDTILKQENLIIKQSLCEYIFSRWF
jgi:hypothetical protein